MSFCNDESYIPKIGPSVRSFVRPQKSHVFLRVRKVASSRSHLLLERICVFLRDFCNKKKGIA